jgi:hypothetical protein
MPDKKWTYPPGPAGGAGQSFTLHEDGSVTIKDADGTETHYDRRTGVATATPPTPPRVTQPEKIETRPDGEIRVSYDHGNLRVKFIPGPPPPPRFKIIRSGGGIPREEEFNLENGRRGVVQQEGGQKTETPPTSATPEEIKPSTHPLPAATPAPAPAPTPAPTPSTPKPKPSDGKKPKKGKASRRRKPAKKPARKAKSRPAARRKKSRR